MLFQNQREGTVSAEMDSELSGTWLGSEKLARKYMLVLYVKRPSPLEAKIFRRVHPRNIGGDNTACVRVVTRRMEVRAKAPSNVKGRNALLWCRYAL